MKSKTIKKADVVKSIDDMQLEMITMRSDLKGYLRSHKIGELVNPRIIKTTKKNIARLMTAVRSSEIAESTKNIKEEK